jgi:UDP-N-acetylglucosamine--N-acetylmuramyl-(pentapeptide) pyrophosphoryl-undecaprenol N-acetylglucosamine transferase
MRALFMVTGRGIGGDAMVALNISRALSKYGVDCQFALDHDANGLLFEKNDIKWHRTSIPQAGGHAATKLSLTKASFKMLKATWEAIKLYRKIRPDLVVGLIGGGAVIGCLAAKILNIPSVGISATPYDSKVSRITTTIALPESPLFKLKNNDKGIKKAYLPVEPDIINGNREKALQLMHEGYDGTLPTIVLSSGSTLFEKMALAAFRIGESRIPANVVVVGHLLDEKYQDYFKAGNILYLGYINWINDLYQMADIAVLSDDGMMVHEAIACKLPVVTLPGVKYGRYHGMARIFEGAVVEGNLEKMDTTIKDVINNMDEMKLKASKYGEEVLESSDKIANIIYRCID